MKRPAVLVLVLTFVALVAATLWVPVEPRGTITRAQTPDGGFDFRLQFANHSMEWERIDRVLESDPPAKLWRAGRLPDDVLVFKNEPPVVRRWLLAFTGALILTIGGLLALALHTRATRRSARARSRTVPRPNATA